MVKFWNGFPNMITWDPQYLAGDGDGSAEIKKRFAMATDKLSKLKFFWNGQDPQTKLRIHRKMRFPHRFK